MTHRFEACAAPLGVDTDDRRRLDPAGPWTLAQPQVGLLSMPPDRRVIGEVTALSIALPGVHCDGAALMLYGTVGDDDVAAQIRAGELFPQLDLNVGRGDDEYEYDGSGLPELLVMRCGQVRALTLGTSPAWPQVWIRIVPAALPAEPVGPVSR